MISDNAWETCEINLVYTKKKGLSGALGGRDWHFEATAIGPNGRYSAGDEKLEFGSGFIVIKGEYHLSGTEPILHEDNARIKLDNLIKTLFAEGWQSTGCGNKWYNARFRRNSSKPI